MAVTIKSAREIELNGEKPVRFLKKYIMNWRKHCKPGMSTMRY